MIRHWNRQTDTGAIHAMGDGHTIAYGFGPEIVQMLAYPLSADSFFFWLYLTGMCDKIP